MPTRVIVAGDRRWWCDSLALRVLNRMRARYGPDLLIVHTGGSGVESAFDACCVTLGIETEPCPVDPRLGPRAEGQANQAMVDRGAAFALVVHRTLERSRSTRDCVARCLAAGIPVWHIPADNTEPVRVRSLEPGPARGTRPPEQ